MRVMKDKSTVKYLKCLPSVPVSGTALKNYIKGTGYLMKQLRAPIYLFITYYDIYFWVFLLSLC